VCDVPEPTQPAPTQLARPASDPAGPTGTLAAWRRLAGGALPPMVLDILAADGILPKLAREGYLPHPASP
jgi:hypothetical protein